MRDHGTGIPMEAQGRIFERFVRATHEHRSNSLGLGLYIARQFVEAHGGYIWVESKPGEGSTFTVELPRYAATKSPGSAAPRTEAAEEASSP